MATRGKPPEGGPGRSTRAFDNVKDGGVRSGWLDGPIHASECHTSKRTKPCLKWVYGPNAECELCGGPHAVRWMGWVPVRREDGRPWIVCISATRFEVVNGIKPGSRVWWGRDAGDGQGVWILPRDKGAEWGHYYPLTRPDADLSHALAVLWRMPEIESALRLVWAVECQPAVTAPPAAASADDMPADAPPELVRIAREQRAARAARTPPAESVADLVNRIPGMNGVHRPHE